MIRELLTKDIKEFIKDNPNSILIDVRSNDEWENIGKPDGNEINLETYFLSIKNMKGDQLMTKNEKIHALWGNCIPINRKEKIKKYIEEEVPYKLAISLNAVNDKVRDELIPINKKWNICQI